MEPMLVVVSIKRPKNLPRPFSRSSRPINSSTRATIAVPFGEGWHGDAASPADAVYRPLVVTANAFMMSMPVGAACHVQAAWAKLSNTCSNRTLHFVL
jgi:hypothetical protein